MTLDEKLARIEARKIADAEKRRRLMAAYCALAQAIADGERGADESADDPAHRAWLRERRTR